MEQMDEQLREMTIKRNTAEAVAAGYKSALNEVSLADMHACATGDCDHEETGGCTLQLIGELVRVSQLADRVLHSAQVIRETRYTDALVTDPPRVWHKQMPDADAIAERQLKHIQPQAYTRSEMFDNYISGMMDAATAVCSKCAAQGTPTVRLHSFGDYLIRVHWNESMDTGLRTEERCDATLIYDAIDKARKDRAHDLGEEEGA